MRPQLEPILESHLAAILMGELLRREDVDDTYVDIVLDDLDLDDSDEYYASFELIRVLPETVATTEFVRVRDTTHDHIATKKYPRSVLDPDERSDIRPLPTGETALDAEQPIVPVYSTPYELIDVEEPFTVTPTALPFPLYSVPYERIDLQDVSQPFVKAAPTEWSSFESTEIVTAPRTASRVIATILVCVGATLLGLTIALYAT